ncbi:MULTISPECIES: Rv3654c family TadE-like protein [Rhodococcus]|uniref:Rv3654c family TadE-like protein n=1 Tax=Rhodococcus TaxID=1827 RepID=UPI00193C4EAD|nr:MULTISPECIES: Rv3654c family TadE-like protein [Rhodococcus]QRI76280.1 flp pilus-assembly TadE/G-like family protein [Rhodococcus aetherivorans]QSE59691.1 flp pilus-assembly TadE/G-like family protein [Rhodococcus sp. PSBB066]QSE68999.1 flp pilus-assembly TadE/G-like family protein [Rhodococcus sp. PSBB049]
MTFGDDRGSASVLGCFVAVALIVVTGLLVQTGAGVATRHRAQAAADLAALAVAGALDRGSDTACSEADRIAARMRVQVRSCTVDGWDAVVEVAAEVSLPAGRQARAIARAGPAG